MLRRRSWSKGRRGFTLLEIVVAVTIIALLSAVIVTAAVNRVREGRAAALARTMSSLGDAILEYRADVRRYPTHLRYLSSVPPIGAKDLCAQTVPASFRDAWKGPYTKSVIAATGLEVSAQTILDSLRLDPAGPYTVSTTGAILIVAENVDSTIANELEERFDGNANLSTGTIRFSATTGELGTMSFAVPVRGC